MILRSTYMWSDNNPAAQAAHWFDWKRLGPALTRVLRRHGTLAIWVSIIG